MLVKVTWNAKHQHLVTLELFQTPKLVGRWHHMEVLEFSSWTCFLPLELSCFQKDLKRAGCPAGPEPKFRDIWRLVRDFTFSCSLVIRRLSLLLTVVPGCTYHSILVAIIWQCFASSYWAILFPSLFFRTLLRASCRHLHCDPPHPERYRPRSGGERLLVALLWLAKAPRRCPDW